MSETIEAALLERLDPDQVTSRRSRREQASHDSSGLQSALPDLVVTPHSVEDVLNVVEAATRRRTPITPRGGGTSRAGGPIPLRGGIALDMTAMNRVLALHPDDRVVVVEAGITASALCEALAPHGLGWGPFLDGGESTVGGLVARNALGPCSTGYGPVRRSVLGVTAVMGSGEVVRAGNASLVASSGYDLAQLLVGSEGTLGILTEVTLSLVVRPPVDASRAWSFGSDSAAARAAVALHRSGVPLMASAWLDTRSTAALRVFKEYPFPDGPGLLLRVAGDDAADLSRRWAAVESLLGTDAAPIALGEPFAAGHWLPRAVAEAHPGTAPIRCDVAVPVGALPEFVALADDLRGRKDAALYLFGDPLLGAVELIIRERADDLEAWDEALDLRDHLMEFAVDRRGASSAGYGVGLDGRRYMKREHGIAIAVMRQLKRALDPAGILNPGKILP